LERNLHEQQDAEEIMQELLLSFDQNPIVDELFTETLQHRVTAPGSCISRLISSRRWPSR
jgi:hypothetical protein